MAEVLAGITLAAKSRVEFDEEHFTDVRNTAFQNAGQPVVVSKREGATNTSDKDQVRQLSSYRAKIAKLSTTDTPFKVATSIRLIDGAAYALLQVDPAPVNEDED